MCGMKRRISTRKARSVTRSVGKVKINRPRRKRGEWEGPRKWEAPARQVQMRTMKAAIGWTTRMYERV